MEYFPLILVGGFPNPAADAFPDVTGYGLNGLFF